MWKECRESKNIYAETTCEQKIGQNVVPIGKTFDSYNYCRKKEKCLKKIENPKIIEAWISSNWIQLLFKLASKYKDLAKLLKNNKGIQEWIKKEINFLEKNKKWITWLKKDPKTINKIEKEISRLDKLLNKVKKAEKEVIEEFTKAYLKLIKEIEKLLKDT